MVHSLRPSALLHRGFVVDQTASDVEIMMITVRPLSRASPCPGCGTKAERIHSRYQRHLADLPIAEKSVRLVIVARRFHCDAVLCGRKFFTERFDPEVLARWARRTAWLDHIAHHLPRPRSVGLPKGRRPRFLTTWKADGQQLHRILQWQVPGRVPEHPLVHEP